ASIANETNPNIRKLSRERKINYHRLLARYNGRDSRSASDNHNKRFNDDLKLVLTRILDRMERDGLNCRYWMIQSVANSLLRRAYTDPNTEPPTVGKN